MPKLTPVFSFNTFFNCAGPPACLLDVCLLVMSPAPCSGQDTRTSPRRAEQVMKALAAAYPGRIERAEFRGGDWAVLLQGVWYYYTGGRLLPEELRNQAAEYDPQPFYNYLPDLPAWKDPSPEEAGRLRAVSNNRSRNPPKRSQHFFDALWRAGSRKESYERVKSLRFLGSTVMVHYTILEELAQAEELILARANTDPDVRNWVNSINTLDGWNWRSIADTQSRSFHAYGAAIDILPTSSGGKETYWLWAARTKPEWWNIPYSQRLHPPQPVIQAFESCGFIWGGKWLFFDTMHFEYRPEILLLSGMPVSGLHQVSND
ncbi:MAG: M15 family metallopeptidase [Treponema sp.]|jgi:hypothetical protein|nr:M15 family metallopeptidase [Treponema sp.]